MKIKVQESQGRVQRVALGDGGSGATSREARSTLDLQVSGVAQTHASQPDDCGGRSATAEIGLACAGPTPTLSLLQHVAIRRKLGLCCFVLKAGAVDIIRQLLIWNA